MTWWLGVIGVAAGALVVRAAVAALPRYVRWRVRRAAERRWKRYAKRTGKDWRKLTPQEKLEAHGVDVDSVMGGQD